MKKIVSLLVAGFMTALLLTNCSNPKNATKTIEDLKAAFKGESNASAKYAGYAQKAKDEGYTQIATLFLAASKAEEIHAKNHKEALAIAGAMPEEFKPDFTVKSTKENLEDAIKGESYEIETMYPGFIADAEKEHFKEAKKSFTWAKDTEIKHLAFYQKALEAIITTNITIIPTEYFVCPKCGNTYDAGSVKEKCDFCGTKKEKFLKFS
jgi:rubrerythrin